MKWKCYTKCKHEFSTAVWHRGHWVESECSQCSFKQADCVHDWVDGTCTKCGSNQQLVVDAVVRRFQGPPPPDAFSGSMISMLKELYEDTIWS